MIVKRDGDNAIIDCREALQIKLDELKGSQALALAPGTYYVSGTLYVGRKRVEQEPGG